ncbi:MAG: IS4 family transposase, partial [Prosthecobacter sp.]
ARLGGHLGRKGDGHPGAQVLWQGLNKLDTITDVWRRLRPQPTYG